mgnify:CR=1 FL=1
MTNIIADINDNRHVFKSSVDHFFSKINISKQLKSSNFYKESGFSCTQILKELFTLVFTGKNLYRSLLSEDALLTFRKNTAYRFLNSEYFNWEKLLYRVMSQLISEVDRLTGKDRESVLIADDSLFSRQRSKKVELLSRVFDHTSHRYCRGFRMLTLGWSDGNTFLPVTFSLLSSPRDEHIICPVQEKDKRTNGYKRRIRARMSTTDVLIEMLRNARSIPAKYVLFDSWFTMPKTVIRVKKENRDVIGMVRISEKIHYFYDGKWQDIKSIYGSIRSGSSDSSKIVGSVCVKIREQRKCELEECVDAKVVFIKKKKSKDWLAVLSTDISLSDEEIIRIYGKRWDIEVFFKVCKSNLALAREFQGRSYDMLTAATAIVFMRYAMLSIEARNESDDRTIGELFYRYCQELHDIRLSQALLLLLSRLIVILKETKPSNKNKLQEKMTELFLNALPSYLRCQLLLCA